MLDGNNQFLDASVIIQKHLRASLYFMCLEHFLKERTLAGLEAAKARRRQVGKPEKLNDEQKELVKALYANKSIQFHIYMMVGIGKTTLYKYINQ